MTNRQTCECAQCRNVNARKLEEDRTRTTRAFVRIVRATWTSAAERAELLPNAYADNVSNVVDRVNVSMRKGN